MPPKRIRLQWPFFDGSDKAHDWLRTTTGYAEYRWYERVAICMGSGMSLEEGMCIAGDDLQREIGEMYRLR